MPSQQTLLPLKLPEDRKLDFVISWDDEEPTIGSIAHFQAQLDGYDSLVYTLQWQYSEDGETWNDLEDAEDMTMDVEVTLDNYEYYWRIVVAVMDILQKR